MKNILLFRKSLFFTFLLIMSFIDLSAQVAITTTGSHNQNFNALSSTTAATPAWADNSTIANWYSQRTGTGTTYAVDAGSGTAGTLYSYGSTSNSDRAIGTIGSSNAAAGSFAHGVLLRNTSGTVVTNISVTYTLEQWRKGGALAAQPITFWYRISSSTISALTPNVSTGWTQVTGLTLNSPINTAGGAALDGNATANKVTATGIAIPSLSLANNDYIMLKWEDPDHASTDHGLSIDDVTINWTVTPLLTTPTVSNTAPSSITTTSASLNGNVTATGGSDILENGSFYSTTDATPSLGEPGVIQLTTAIPSIGTGAFSNGTDSILSVNTQYFYNAYARNAQGYAYGTASSFYTLANLPIAPTVNNPTTTTLDVAIDTADGNPALETTYAIEVGTGNYVQTATSSILAGTPVYRTAAQWGTTTVTGLIANTSYTFRVYARNGSNVSTTFGPSTTVSTSPNLVATLTAGLLTGFGNVCINTTSGANGFTLTGVNLDGSNVIIGPLANYIFDSGSGYGPTATISGYGSAFSTTINVKFEPTAVLSYGGNIPVSGGNASAINVAVTGSGINTPVSVTTSGSSLITAATATITGVITQGCSAISASGMEYSTASDMSGSIPVSNPANLTGLAANTQYYFRAYASDDTGTVNGSILSFTTSQLPAPGVLSGNPISYDSFTANWSAVSGADDYQLDVSTSPTFSSQINTTGLFISEYGEGLGGNKKYIEIYNGTGASVNLANYQVWQINNGGTWPESTLTLSGTLLNNDVFVIASNPTDVIGADLYVTPINAAPLNFNGDDAMGLAYNGGSGIVFTLVDAVGTDGADPGTGWAVAGTANATVDKILIRKSSIFVGNTNWATSAGTNTSDSEWIVSSFAYNATNQTTDLGLHTINNSTPSFIVENLTVAGTSSPVTGLSANTNYYYRARAHSTTSTSSNSTVVTVTTTFAPPTFGSIVQGTGDVCENSTATFEISGLLPNRSFIIHYTIDGNPFTSPAISSNLSGSANLQVLVVLINNGQTLEVTQVEDVVSTQVLNVTLDNTVTIAVLANVTYYQDFDNDTYGDINSSVQSCSGAPGGYVLDSTDCDDNDNTKHTTFSFYADSDLDGVGAGTIQSGVCAVDANTPPSGYSLTGTDCAPGDINVWRTGLFYVDADGDNYSSGLATTSLCYGATEPVGFSILNLGLDCDDTITAINPGQAEILYDGVDNNCNGQLDEGFQITTTMQGCGTTLTSIGSLMSAVSLGAPITGYRFEVTTVGSFPLEVQVVTGIGPNFSLTQLPSYAYATTYSIRCMLQRSGIWLGYYGPACNISSPAVLAPGGATSVTPSQCGITLPTISTLIATTSLAGATGYKFRVTNQRTSFTQELTRSLHWFSLTMLTQYNYGDTYTVEVAIKTTGDFSGYGSPCNVTAPAVPSLTSQCSTIIPAKTTNIATASLALVTSYDFEVKNMVSNAVSNVSNNLNWFRLNMISNYAPNTQFRVRVRVLSSGIYSDYGDACFITSPAFARTVETLVDSNVFEVTASPNPFDTNFGMFLNATSTEDVSIRVYDMIGKLIEQREVKATEVVTQEVGNNYPSGVYNVIVSQGADIKTLRVIKR